MKSKAFQSKFHICESLNLIAGIVAKMKKINSHFVSEIDQFLAKFDQQHSESEAQRLEREKYQKIYQQRDEAITIPPSKRDILWD